METIAKPFYLLWKIYFLLVFLVAFLVLFPFYIIIFSLGERPFNFGFRLMKWHSWFISLMTLTRFKFDGKEEFPEPPYIVCSNHSSYTDIVYSYCFIPDYFVFLAKKELGSIPGFKVFFKAMNILVDRSNPVEAKKSLQMCSDRIDEGESIIIFPEGTIPHHTPKMKNFKNGPFKLAIDKQVPIVPVTFADNHRRMSEGSWWGKAGPGKARIFIHTPIYTDGMTQEDLVSLKKQTFDSIAAPIIEHQ